MTTLRELERLRDRAIADPREEGAYLHALLSTTLYAHIPLSDDSGKQHLVMFTRPDGIAVIPVFTDLLEARAAAGGAVCVAAVTGRDLFEATRGATLMLDPNGVGMTLYPEEIFALLDEGRAAPAPVPFEGPGLELLPADVSRDGWLLDVVATSLASIRVVKRVHLAAARPLQSTGAADRLIVIVATPPAGAARAIAIAVECSLSVPCLPIDLATYSPDDPLPEPLAEGLRHAWTRELCADSHG